MAFRKRKLSPEVQKGIDRLQGIQQTEPNFDFGNGLTSATIQAQIEKVQSGTSNYNNLLTQADGVGTLLDNDEKNLKDLNSRVLNAIGGKYGFDSIEYEKAGGTRTSEIKRSTSKKTTATTTV